MACDVVRVRTPPMRYWAVRLAGKAAAREKIIVDALIEQMQCECRYRLRSKTTYMLDFNFTYKIVL